MGAQGFQVGDVDFLDIAEMRDASLGVLHLLGDLATQADHRHRLFVVSLGIPCAAPPLRVTLPSWVR